MLLLLGITGSPHSIPATFPNELSYLSPLALLAHSQVQTMRVYCVKNRLFQNRLLSKVTTLNNEIV